MKLRRVVIAACYMNIAVFSATAETAFSDMRACPPVTPKVVLLRPETKRLDDHVVIYYAAAEPGWASRRILARFDVEGMARRDQKRRCPS
jgi:hypothetical protein